MTTIQPPSLLSSQSSYRRLGIKLLQRSWWRHWIYPLLFLLAMILSLSTYLTLDSVQQSVDQYVSDNQRALVGGDLVIKSRQAWSKDVLDTVTHIPDIDLVYDYQFNAMVSRLNTNDAIHQSPAQEQTILALIKAVSTNYPLYGEVVLASGKPLWQQLQPQTVVVETQVLTRLSLQVGDELKIGGVNFIIADELITEPDRPLTAFGFGARVLMADTDLDATNLMGQRSRVNYRIELAGEKDAITNVQTKLSAVINHQSDIKLSKADEADTSISTISDNVLMFLKLLVIAVLFLSAVALHGVVKAFVNLQQTSNAIRRAIGESVGSVKRSYYQIFVAVSVMACIGAVLLSFVMLGVSANFLTAILPADIVLSIKWLSVLKISLVDFVMMALVLQHSLHVVTHTKPSAVLKQSMSHSSQRLPWTWYVMVVIASLGLMAWEFGSLIMGAQILVGMMTLVACLWLIQKIWIWLLATFVKKGAIGLKAGWMVRIAVHNLSRKGNQSVLFFITLALSVAILTMISLVNHSLNKQFVQAYPEDAPNLFLLDVQTQQHDQLNTMIPAPITYYPVVRARIIAVNDTPVSDIKVSKGEGDDPTRVFNLSYRDTVMETEFIKESIEPEQLYTPINQSDLTNNGGQMVMPLSILDSAADLLGAEMGDKIHFNVQGINITGQITSVRERYERGPSPFFYFLFEPSVLADAPQIQFATTKVANDDIAMLQTELAREFPAITTINGGMIALKVQSYVAQMSQLVQIFTLFATITGLIVLVTSLLSTSQDRLRDSASFRLLGMKTADLYKINILEIGILGLSAGLFATITASVVSYALITDWFDFRFSVPWDEFILGALLLCVILLSVAIGYVRLVIRKGIMARVRQMV